MKIIVAIDGSPSSRHALQALAHLAPPEEFVLVHAIAIPDFNYAMISPDLRTEIQAEMEAKLRKEGEGILSQAREKLPSDFPQVQKIHQIGHPVDVILETARSSKSHLIILGARGLGAFKELVLGSTSHRVLMHAPCSTMVIKEPVPRLKKILLPVEGEEDIAIALQFLARQPFREPVDIDVIAVWPQPQLAWPITLGQTKLLEMNAIEAAQDRMTSVTDRLTRMNYSSQTKVGMGDPAFAILEQAKASEADMILMGTHGRGGLARFLIGSVSNSVLHQADCPVLIVR
ncbi:MAG: universal stress protein [Nitrospirota bacterium]|nr:universal stress protein [Nitrospirota bacterium]MDH5586138.1 universal stress protein [Nitrospirota bacterium]